VFPCDDEITVDVAFMVEGPLDVDDPPWGPQAYASVPMTDIDGPIAYATAGGMRVALRGGMAALVA
jgi:hypothetical protein